MVVGLIEVEAIFAGASFLGYFTIHELKEKDVRRIRDDRLRTVRGHLSELAKKSAESKAITKDIESEFQNLFENEYSKAYEPTNTLKSVDFSLLLSSVLFLVSALLDWASSSLPSLSNLALSPLEAELFMFGAFLLGVGVFSLERLRKMTEKESDIDPAPLGVILPLGLLFATDVYFLWITGSTYSNLTNFGKTLFFSSFLPFFGITIAITTWEKEDWKRNFGMILLFAPYLLILGAFILSILNIPFP